LQSVRLGKRSVAFVVCGLGLLIGADRLELWRPDAFAAVGCVSTLFDEQESPLHAVLRYRDVINAEAKRADLPPELLAAIIANHHGALTPFRRFTDCFGSALGGDLSLGPAQVRISTAVRADGAGYDTLSAADFRRYRVRLLDPSANIRYQARELRLLLDRDSRFPGMSAEALIDSPGTMALLITEYRVGRIDTPMDPAIRRTHAVSALRFMHARDFYVFSRSDDDALRIRSRIETYLTHMNCESRNFSPAVCEEWTEFLRAGGAVQQGNEAGSP
jgi:hypothetical protein